VFGGNGIAKFGMMSGWDGRFEVSTVLPLVSPVLATDSTVLATFSSFLALLGTGIIAAVVAALTCLLKIAGNVFFG